MKKRERLSFYKRLLKEVCEDPSVEGLGFCHYIFEMTLKSKKPIEYDDMEKKFPELWAKKPIREWNSLYWFSCTYKGWQKRITLLEEVIHEMENKTK